MKRTHCISIATLSLLAAAVGCTAEAPPAEELTAEQSAALEASIEDLGGHRAALPVADDELREIGAEFVLASQADAACAHRGIVSGIWYDAELKPRFEGSWFELGTSDFGGSVAGQYGEGLFVGDVTGPELTGEVDGAYARGVLRATWAVTATESGAPHDGELIGRYERRNDHGGYFFGVWTECEPAETAEETPAE